MLEESEELQTYINTSNLRVNTVKHLSWIKYDLLHLKKYAYIYVDNGEMYPNFGKVLDILSLQCCDSSCIDLVRIQKCESLYFDSLFNGYVIQPLSQFSYARISSFPTYPVLHSHKPFGHPETLITLKHSVM